MDQNLPHSPRGHSNTLKTQPLIEQSLFVIERRSNLKSTMVALNKSKHARISKKR